MVTLARWGAVKGQAELFALDLAGVIAPEVPAAREVPAMSKDAARWVRENVWTEDHRKWNGGPDDWFHCRCQWAATGDCARGEHRACVRTRGAGPSAGPDTHLTISGRKRLHIAVWLADRTCSWSCPCECGHRSRDCTTA